jgi:hypothetical protein
LTPVFMFCASGLFFGGSEGVGSRFHVLRAPTRFRMFRGRRVPFSSFVSLDSFSSVLRASGLDSMFCAHGLIFGDTDCVESRFHVLRYRTRFRRFRGRRVPFSCFASPDSFSTVRRAPGLVFMFCAPGLVSDGAECVGSRFHVLRVQSRFRWFRGRRVPFSCFTRPDSFSVVPRASGPVFMFFAPGLFFDDTENIGSRFHVLHARTLFRRYR